MRTTEFFRIAAVLSLLAALVSPALAQTTGGIVGRVADENGGGLAGVTVEVESAVLQGSRVTTTGTDGQFRLTLLPPGDYALTFQLAGFGMERQTTPVGLGRDTTVNTTLRPSEAEEITVVSDSAVIDLRSTALGVNLDQKAIESLPTGRNYSSMAQFVPGIASDANPDNTSQSTISVSAPPAPRTPSSSTASTPPASSTASRARSSTSSSSRRSTSRPAATRPNTGARRGA